MECIFCSACIRFVECCLPEGLTGLLCTPLISEFGNFNTTLKCDRTWMLCREALVWAWELCVWLAYQCRQVSSLCILLHSLGYHIVLYSPVSNLQFQSNISLLNLIEKELEYTRIELKCGPYLTEFWMKIIRMLVIPEYNTHTCEKFDSCIEIFLENT